MPLLWISLAFFAGLVLGQSLPGSGGAWLIGGALLLVLSLALRMLARRITVPHSPNGGQGLWAAVRWLYSPVPRLRVSPLLLCAALAFGAARIQFGGPDLANGHIAAYNDQGLYQIVAVVDAPPDRRDTTTLARLRAESITRINAQGKLQAALPTHGLLLALTPGRADWQYGDRLTLEGRLETPPENETFSYRAYLAHQNVYSYLTYPKIVMVTHDAGNPIMAAIYRLRGWAYQTIFRLYPAPEAPLLAGILLGIDSDMPDALTRAFQDTGTAHVIAISGFNIAILAELFSKWFGKVFSRGWASGLAILVISGYTVMVGATPSVVRAAIMGSLALIGSGIGRRSAGANTLAFTAALMCLQNPFLPWDASFQLSFGATLGLILYGERFQQGFTNWLTQHVDAPLAQSIAKPVGEYVLLTLAAQLMTLPVVLYHFQRLSISSLLANPLILPPQPLVMVLSGAAVLLAGISQPLAQVAAWLVWPLSAYTNRMVELLASIPGGVVTFGKLNALTVALLYVLILLPVVNSTFPAMLKKAVSPSMVLLLLGFLTTLALRGAVTAPDGKLHVRVFDIAGSQMVFVRAPHGETLLINGGPSTRQINAALDRWQPPFERDLDGLFINAAPASTLDGLQGMLDSRGVRQVWWGLEPPKTRSAEHFYQALQDQSVQAQRLAVGDTLAMGADVHVTVLATRASGSALRITWRNFSALLPSGFAPTDLPPEVLTNISALLLGQADLKMTTPQAWQALVPQITIVTQPAVALPPTGMNWYNTHAEGWYELISDGERLWVQADK